MRMAAQPALRRGEEKRKGYVIAKSATLPPVTCDGMAIADFTVT